MSTLKCTTLSKQDGSKSVPVDTVVNGSAKAWVNFNGTGTVAIRAAFNVSSITDNGVGDYSANFATAMPDALYVVEAMSRNTGAGGFTMNYSESNLPGSARVVAVTHTVVLQDCQYIHVAIFR